MQHYQPQKQPQFNPAVVNHPLLSRLMDEINDEKQRAIYAKYDRTHNRHNRNL